MFQIVLGFSVLLTAQNALATRNDPSQTTTNNDQTSRERTELPQSIRAASGWHRNLSITVIPPTIDSGVFDSESPPERSRPNPAPRGRHYTEVRINPDDESPKRKDVTITPHGSMWIHSPSHGNSPYPHHRKPVRNEDARIEAHVTRQNSR